MQLEEAQKAGADWCSTGWVKGENEAFYPITTQIMNGCGNGSPGIKSWTPPDKKAAVNCYGPKPQKSANIQPFNLLKWSMNTPIEWKCLTGTNVPLRKNTQGDVECMSQNNKDCLWKANETECNQLLLTFH
jgi:hypothetical protein